MDLRGHGLSDAPTTGVRPRDAGRRRRRGRRGRRPRRTDAHAADRPDGVVWPATATGRSSRPGPRRHSADAAPALVLVDGGWQDVGAATGMDARRVPPRLEEPPEVMRSMAAYLADRRELGPGDAGTPTRSGRPGRPSSKCRPATSCRSTGRTRSSGRSRRCSPTGRSRRCAALEPPIGRSSAVDDEAADRGGRAGPSSRTPAGRPGGHRSTSRVPAAVTTCSATGRPSWPAAILRLAGR